MVSIRAPRPSTTRGRARPIRQVRGAEGKSTGTTTRPGLKGSRPRTSSRTRAPCSQTFHPRRSTPAPPPGPHRHLTTSPRPTTSARRRGDPLPGRRARTDARARRGRSTRRTGSTSRGRPQFATATAPGRRRRRRRRRRRPPGDGGSAATGRSSGAIIASFHPCRRWRAPSRSTSPAATPDRRSTTRRLPTRPSIAGVEEPRAPRPHQGLDSERSVVAPGTGPPVGAVPITPGARRSERTPPARRTPSTRRRTTATSIRFDVRFTTRRPRIRPRGSMERTPTARWPRWTRAVTARCTSPWCVARGARSRRSWRTSSTFLWTRVHPRGGRRCRRRCTWDRERCAGSCS